MEIESPEKTYVVKYWEIRLKSGAVASYNIREDKGETYAREDPWFVWWWPQYKRSSRILESEIAAMDYQEVEQKELKLYKPKRKAHAAQEETAISARSGEETREENPGE